MKTIRLQPLVSIILLTWASVGVAQNAGIDQAGTLRQGYGALQESAPIMTEQQQQMFEHKIKTLELKQAWESNYTNATAGAHKKALQNNGEAELEQEVEYFIEE